MTNQALRMSKVTFLSVTTKGWGQILMINIKVLRNTFTFINWKTQGNMKKEMNVITVARHPRSHCV